MFERFESLESRDPVFQGKRALDRGGPGVPGKGVKETKVALNSLKISNDPLLARGINA